MDNDFGATDKSGIIPFLFNRLIKGILSMQPRHLIVIFALVILLFGSLAILDFVVMAHA